MYFASIPNVRIHNGGIFCDYATKELQVYGDSDKTFAKITGTIFFCKHTQGYKIPEVLWRSRGR